MSRWDRQVIADIKQYVNKYTLLPDSEFPPQSDAFWASARRPEFRSVSAQLFERGLQTRGELEYDLGRQMGTVFPK